MKIRVIVDDDKEFSKELEIESVSPEAVVNAFEAWQKIDHNGFYEFANNHGGIGSTHPIDFVFRWARAMSRRFIPNPGKEPPFDRIPCIACPVEVRELFASAHNLVNAAVSGDINRTNKKMNEMADAVLRMQPIVAAHFEDPAHAKGSISQLLPEDLRKLN